MADLSLPTWIASGGRDFMDGGRILADLRALQARAGANRLSQGGARGADEKARIAALGLGLGGTTYPAFWQTEGRRAGRTRNVRMNDAERPDGAVFYPDHASRGTWHCLEVCLERGIPCAVWLAPGIDVVAVPGPGDTSVQLFQRTTATREAVTPDHVRLLERAQDFRKLARIGARLVEHRQPMTGGTRLVLVPMPGRPAAIVADAAGGPDLGPANLARLLAQILNVPAEARLPPALALDVRIGDRWRLPTGGEWIVVGDQLADGSWPMSGPGPGRAMRYTSHADMVGAILIHRDQPRGA